MSSLRENAVTLISSTSVDMKTAQSNALFNVPVGKKLFIDHVVIRGNSASLAGGTSYALTGWRSGISLTGMTTTTDYRKLLSVDNTSYTPVSAATLYFIVTTGATAAGTATVEVFGHLA